MNNAQILMVAPNYTNSEKTDYNYTFPLGLAYVLSALKHKGMSPDVLNLNHLDGKSDQLLTAVLDRNKYDIVCTGGNSLLYHELKTIINTANEHPSHPATVLGGPVITSEPELIFEALRPDYGVMGEGEVTTPELIDSIINKTGLAVMGTVYWRNGKATIAPVRSSISNLNEIPFPEFDDLGLNEWLDKLHCNCNYSTFGFDYPRLYPLMGSRGCPFKCTFCFHYEKHRERSLDNIFEELEAAVVKYNINIIGLYDDCFSLSPSRVREFCRRITELRTRIGRPLYWGVQLTVKNITDEMLTLLKNAGCNSISYGFESFSAPVLKSMHKPIKPEEINNALRKTLEHHIVVQANFIMGDRAETRETANETLDYWKKNCDGQVTLGFIQPYPGSEIYRHCVRKKIITDKLSFIEHNIAGEKTINFTDNMSDEDYRRLTLEIYGARLQYRRYAVPSHVIKNGERYAMDITCPYCRQSFTCHNILVKKEFLFLYRFDFGCRFCARRFFVVSRFFPALLKLLNLMIRFKIATPLFEKVMHIMYNAAVVKKARKASAR